MRNKILPFIALSAIALTTFSCSDDDKPTSEKNPLIGKWNEIEIVGESPLNDCEKQSNYQFTDAVLTYQEYRLNDNGDCAQSSEDSAPYQIVEDKIIIDETETRFVINGDNLTLFHPQGEGSVVEARYVKAK